MDRCDLKSQLLNLLIKTPVSWVDLGLSEAELRDWITALRSGEYRQGAPYLCQFDASGWCYSAAGVLVERNWQSWGWTRQRAKTGNYDWFSAPHPRSKSFAIDIPAQARRLNRRFVQTHLWRMEDAGLRFPDAADAMETYFLARKAATHSSR